MFDGERKHPNKPSGPVKTLAIAGKRGVQAILGIKAVRERAATSSFETYRYVQVQSRRALDQLPITQLILHREQAA